MTTKSITAFFLLLLSVGTAQALPDEGWPLHGRDAGDGKRCAHLVCLAAR